jgi:anti-anti-sigma factor
MEIASKDDGVCADPVVFEVGDGELLCRFAGRMDTAMSMRLEDEVFDQALRHREDNVIFDLEKVSFVSSAFYRICLKTARATKAMKVTVVKAAPHVREGFTITGLDRILDIVS